MIFPYLHENFVMCFFLQVGEVGELSEIFQWKGEVEKGLPNWSRDDKEHLEDTAKKD